MIHVEGDIVEFRFRCGISESVYLAGDFNDWSLLATPMALISADVWRVTLKLAPGDYRFRYFTSHRGWVTDWAAFGVERNPFGGWNSIVHVAAVARQVTHPVSPTDAQVEPAPDAPHLCLRHVGEHQHLDVTPPDASTIVPPPAKVGVSPMRRSAKRR